MFKIIVVVFSSIIRFYLYKISAYAFLVNCQYVNCRLLGRTLDVLLYPYKFLCWKMFFQCYFLCRILQHDRKSIFFNRGIKHDFPFINTCKVPREVLKTEGEARGFQPSRGTLQMLMNDKIMFDRYYCINSTKHCENEENIGALYFITSSHFPTR